ncbi:Os04g0180900 [Oryza sativa Japonica Group]|uniref:Os04g0180900 protein n=2 Tax=Oryza sativa subsp. japonica TaxID=39947 RepID=A0A0P0W7D0_ORYSJ|nr:hypothetical protein OsJ_13979 [Oryza sativa Japonica Group]KAB8094876.1 hypothetical protein EE612_022301 [Oryza sativa]BAF14092.1 Os04g0180900 [Oryza sativa Japonica Group]BAS87959.1 Os04g0180900 [Oryza sativa Japonica Group]|eukprot:NP_001052178.1 Os04g0180900 [Oryza sativa Japonica Group]
MEARDGGRASRSQARLREGSHVADLAAGRYGGVEARAGGRNWGRGGSRQQARLWAGYGAHVQPALPSAAAQGRGLGSGKGIDGDRAWRWWMARGGAQ